MSNGAVDLVTALLSSPLLSSALALLVITKAVTMHNDVKSLKTRVKTLEDEVDYFMSLDHKINTAYKRTGGSTPRQAAVTLPANYVVHEDPWPSSGESESIVDPVKLPSLPAPARRRLGSSPGSPRRSPTPIPRGEDDDENDGE